MARLTFKRLLLVGVAVAAGAAYAKREQVRQLLPGGSCVPEPSRTARRSPRPSNYDAPGPAGQHRDAGPRAGDAGA